MVPPTQASGAHPTDTHILLLPALVLLSALSPDAGGQAVADHVNQLCWNVYEKPSATYMFLQRSYLSRRTVTIPSKDGIPSGRHEQVLCSLAGHVPMLVQAVCSCAYW